MHHTHRSPFALSAHSVIILAIVMVGCARGSTPGTAHETAATVERPRTEAELTTVKLSEDAVKRLGIETVAVQTDSTAATRTLGGEVVVPEGRGVVVTAPVAGTVTATTGVQPGARVRRGDRLMTLTPLMAAERDQRTEAQRAVSAAEAEELAARQRRQRLEQLLKDGAASMRSIEEASAQHQVTVATLTAARERLAGASKSSVGAQGELVVSAPFEGIVQSVSAVQGQTVAAAAPLLQLSQVDTLWIRVPVYAGDADKIDSTSRSPSEDWAPRARPDLPRASSHRSGAIPRLRRLICISPCPARESSCGLVNACSLSCRSRARTKGSWCLQRRCSTTSMVIPGSMRILAGTPTRAAVSRLPATRASGP